MSWLLFIVSLPALGAQLIHVPSGLFMPLYPHVEVHKKNGEIKLRSAPVPIQSFFIDECPVTNTQYLEFVQAESQWKKSNRQDLFAEPSYLAQWKSDTEFDSVLANVPVTNVSWFAAKAYCKFRHKRLPTTNEWEYLGEMGEEKNGESEALMRQKILAWYSNPTDIPTPVGTTSRNYLGVKDLHGLVWEWTLDFSALMAGDSRAGSDRGMFCGAGSLGASDFKDYPAFMRFAFRSSLKANYTLKNLGFRCASSEELK